MVLQGILTRVRGESSKLNSMILGNEESPEKQKGINSFLEPISASAVVYPSLDSMASKGDSGNLYPSLDSRTPTRRAAFSATTSKKKRQGVLEEDTCFVTPSRTGHFTIPRNSSFNFEANSGLGEAGKKIMEELKLSSAVVKAQMCPGSSVKASPMANPKTPGKGPRKRRFSDAHSKQFAQ